MTPGVKRRRATVYVRKVDINYDEPGRLWLVTVSLPGGFGTTLGSAETFGAAQEYAQELSILNAWSLNLPDSEPARG